LSFFNLNARAIGSRAWRSRFARNVTILVSGTAGAHAITIVFAPFLTRIYGPEAFGLLGTFMAIVSVATPLAALAYPIAIVLPREDSDALGLVRLSTFLSFLMALLATAILAVMGGWLTKALGTQEVAGCLFLIPVAMLFAAWTQVAHQWLIRKGEFAAIARSVVVHSLMLNGSKAGLGLLNPIGAVLIVLATLGHAVHAFMLYFAARRCYSPPVDEVKMNKPMALMNLAKEQCDFPLYRAPQNFINAASQALPVLMLAAFFGPVAAGFYTLAKMVMGMPSALIGKGINDAFYPKITAAAYNGEDIVRLIVQATGVLLAVGVVPFGVVVIFGPWIFGFIFGEDWIIAGEYARWLALFFLFNFINKPAVAAVPVLKIQRGLLIYEVFSTGTKVLGFILGFYWFDSDLWAIALFSVIGVIAYSAMILWIIAHAMLWRADGKAS